MLMTVLTFLKNTLAFFQVLLNFTKKANPIAASIYVDTLHSKGIDCLSLRLIWKVLKKNSISNRLKIIMKTKTNNHSYSTLVVHGVWKGGGGGGGEGW